MFLDKKIAYIFAALGDNSKETQKVSFFEKLINKYKKTDESKNLVNQNDIFLQSEKLISSFSKYTEGKCFSFYYYLKKSHKDFIKKIKEENADKYYILPLSPQSSYHLNLMANFFRLNFKEEVLGNFFWVKSYHLNPLFIKSIQKNINEVIKKNNLDQKDTIFLFLANGGQNFLYSFECELTCQKIIKSYQFIHGELFYYPADIKYLNGLEKLNRKNIILIPISTLLADTTLNNSINLLKSYLEKEKKIVFSIKPLNESQYFIRSIFDIIEEKNFISNDMLLSMN